MGERKVAGAIALAVAALLALSGCVPTDETTNRNLIELELARLSGALYELPYVEVVSAIFYKNEDSGQQIRVAVSVEEPTLEQAIVLTDTVNAALSIGAMTTFSRLFDLRIGSVSRIQQSAFDVDRERLADEIRYLYALEESFGTPLAMYLDGGWLGNDFEGYQRIISSMSPEGGDWDALRQVSDPYPSNKSSWYLNGMSAVDSLPPIAIVDALRPLATALPQPGGSGSLGYSWSAWESSTQRFELRIESFEELQSSADTVSSLELWPLIVDTAASLKASGVPNIVLTVGVIVAGEPQQASVHFGDCTMVEVVFDADEEFAAALADSGVDMSASSGPGYCTVFRQG